MADAKTPDKGKVSGKKKTQKRATKKQKKLHVDIATFNRALVKTEQLLPPDEHQTLVNAKEALLLMSQMVHAPGATLSGLRRSFPNATSEKTNTVLSDDDSNDASVTSGDTKDDSCHAEGPSDETDSCTGSGEAPSDSLTADPSTPKTDGADTTKEPKNHGRRPADDFKNAEVIKVPHPNLKAGDECPGCHGGPLYEAPPIVLIQFEAKPPVSPIRLEYDRFRCSTCGQTFTALPSDDKELQSLRQRMTPSATSMTMVLHYLYGFPFNRLQNLQHHLGAPLPKSNQYEAVQRQMVLFGRIFGAMLSVAADSKLFYSDDTRVRIRQLMGKSRKKLEEEDGGGLLNLERVGLRTTGILAETAERTIALFFSGQNIAGENLAAVLDRRSPELEQPIHMSDGLSHNDPGNHDVTVARCIPHARRNVIDEVNNHHAKVAYILKKLRVAFKNDKIAKKSKMSPEERLSFHQKHTAPTMAELKEWIEKQLDDKLVEPNSGMGGALKYMKNHWHGLTEFLRTPGVPLSNNACERALKRAIFYRKNSYFYQSIQGAAIGDICMSLGYTAELCGENPYEYFTAVMKNAEAAAKEPSKWMPWNYRDNPCCADGSLAAA